MAIGVTTLLRTGFGPPLQGCCRNRWDTTPERAGNLVRCGPAWARVDVGVEVRSDGDLGVAQPLGDHLQVDPGVQRQAGVRVAQVVVKPTSA